MGILVLKRAGQPPLQLRTGLIAPITVAARPPSLARGSGTLIKTAVRPNVTVAARPPSLARGIGTAIKAVSRPNVAVAARMPAGTGGTVSQWLGEITVLVVPMAAPGQTGLLTVPQIEAVWADADQWVRDVSDGRAFITLVDVRDWLFDPRVATATAINDLITILNEIPGLPAREITAIYPRGDQITGSAGSQLTTANGPVFESPQSALSNTMMHEFGHCLGFGHHGYIVRQAGNPLPDPPWDVSWVVEYGDSYTAMGNDPMPPRQDYSVDDLRKIEWISENQVITNPNGTVQIAEMDAIQTALPVAIKLTDVLRTDFWIERRVGVNGYLCRVSPLALDHIPLESGAGGRTMSVLLDGSATGGFIDPFPIGSSLTLPDGRGIQFGSLGNVTFTGTTTSLETAVAQAKANPGTFVSLGAPGLTSSIAYWTGGGSQLGFQSKAAWDSVHKKIKIYGSALNGPERQLVYTASTHLWNRQINDHTISATDSYWGDQNECELYSGAMIFPKTGTGTPKEFWRIANNSTSAPQTVPGISVAAWDQILTAWAYFPEAKSFFGAQYAGTRLINFTNGNVVNLPSPLNQGYGGTFWGSIARYVPGIPFMYHMGGRVSPGWRLMWKFGTSGQAFRMDDMPQDTDVLSQVTVDAQTGRVVAFYWVGGNYPTGHIECWDFDQLRGTGLMWKRRNLDSSIEQNAFASVWSVRGEFNPDDRAGGAHSNRAICYMPEYDCTAFICLLGNSTTEDQRVYIYKHPA